MLVWVFCVYYVSVYGFAGLGLFGCCMGLLLVRFGWCFDLCLRGVLLISLFGLFVDCLPADSGGYGCLRV